MLTYRLGIIIRSSIRDHPGCQINITPITMLDTFDRCYKIVFQLRLQGTANIGSCTQDRTESTYTCCRCNDCNRGIQGNKSTCRGRVTTHTPNLEYNSNTT